MVMLSELRATLRVITQIVATETSSTPLKYLYRCYYKLAKHFFCRQLNQIPGVSAAYCLDGKKSHPIYGLSDIDLFVVVSSHDAKNTSKTFIENVTRFSQCFVPQMNFLFLLKKSFQTSSPSTPCTSIALARTKDMNSSWEKTS